MRLGEPHPFPRQPVDIRRPDLRRAIAADIAVAQVVGEDDDDVRPPFRRRGLGTALLQAVSAAAAAAGARHAVLNATPELYETCGFRQIGEGITWWLDPRGG